MSKKHPTVAALILFALTAGSATGSEEAIGLQFHPQPGAKRTMRVHSKLSTTHQGRAGQECTEHIKTFTVEIEPSASAEDGTVTLRIGVLGLFLDDHMNDTPFLQYDSSKNRDYDMGDAQFRALIGESFLVTASAQGRLVELKTDPFFTAVGANRMTLEDQALRLLPGGSRGEDRIKNLNDHYGSPQQRKQAYTEGALKSFVFGTDQLRVLASQVLLPLAPEPVKAGADWKGPVLLSIECPMELAGTYTLRSLENDVCTIEAQAQRTPESKPLSSRYPRGSTLSGTYRATLKVDRATGGLLAREAVMNLTGGLFMPGHSAAGAEGTVPITTVATTTVEMVKLPPPDANEPG